MNFKLFVSSLVITSGMIFWVILQPGTTGFILARLIIAFISIILMYIATIWNKKGAWKYLVFFLSLSTIAGSIVFLMIDLGLANYPVFTAFVCIGMVILILLYIKFIEPKLLILKKSKDFNKKHPELKN